jgi:hypothetical protein
VLGLVARRPELRAVEGVAVRALVVVLGLARVVDSFVCTAQSSSTRALSGDGRASYAVTVLAQLVVPPYGGIVTPRRMLIAGTRSTNVTSVCQLLAAIPWVAARLSTWALPVLTVGWAVVRVPSCSANAI